MIGWVLCAFLIIFVNVTVFLTGMYSFKEDNDLTRLTKLHVIPDEMVFETDAKFLSFSYDMSLMHCVFHKLNDMQWYKLEQLGELLAPGYLRFGGTEADNAYFDVKANPKNRTFFCSGYPTKGFPITDKDLFRMFFYASNIKFKILMNLNALLRSDSDWNSANAKSMLRFAENYDYEMDFQLGNEPNRFPKLFKKTIPPDQLARDFNKLRRLIKKMKLYKHSKVVGPDVGGETPPTGKKFDFLGYLREFLSHKPSIDAVTFHQYTMTGFKASLSNYTNPETFDVFGEQLESVKTVVKQEVGDLPIWLTETSSSYGAGGEKLYDKFVATFMWLDKLGLAARKGVSVVVRQTLLTGSYALADGNFNPSPDYWISAFFNNAVGTKVIKMTLNTGNIEKKHLRFYCHCLNHRSQIQGTIIIYGLNVGNETEGITTQGLNVVYPISAYIFKAGENNLRSKDVSLNWQLLAFNFTKFSYLAQMGEKTKLPLKLPAYSIGFWAITIDQNNICR